MRLAASIETYAIRLYLYCLMPNHLHLVLETPKPNLSRFMQSWQTGYTQYFNKRHDLCGHLFQGRFKARLVDGDKYLLALSRYVHLNPVRIHGCEKIPLPERTKMLRQYLWSSYRAYIGQIDEPEWLKTGPVLMQVGEGRSNLRRAYQRFIETGLAESNDEFETLMHNGKPWLGSDALGVKYAEHVRAKLKHLKRPEDVAVKPYMDIVDSAVIMKRIAKLMNCKIEEMCRRRCGVEYKGLVAKALKRHTVLTNREIAPLLGLRSGAAVSWLERRINELIASETEVRNTWKKVETAFV